MAKNAKQARICFLENASTIIKDQLYLAKNDTKLSPGQRQLFDTLSKMIVAESDMEKIKTKSSADILELLGKGKVSVAQAVQLMELMKGKAEIDLSEDLMEKLDKLKK